MISPMPKVSVVIPAYNASRHICDAVQTALDQSYADIEIIVVDDGSKDGTGDLVRSRFPQVTCVTKPNGGASSARNLGCQMATGELIAFLDSDDEWHREKIAAQVALMAAYPQADLNRTSLQEASVRDEPALPVDAATGLPAHTCYTRFVDGYNNPFFATSTVMVRKTAYDRAGGFDPQLNVAEDIDFFLRVMAQAPLVPCVSGLATFKRPVKGSLGDDSEEGYVRLLQVYPRFLQQHPQVQAEMGDGAAKRMLATLWGRYASSQYRNGKGLHAVRSALRSFFLSPNTLALRVMALVVFKPRPRAR
jgi:glycosyltransferase involved in cell wall biosynthesis